MQNSHTKPPQNSIISLLDADDWRALDALILKLHSLRSPAEFEEFILGPVCRFLGARFASWNEHNEAMVMERVVNSPDYQDRIAPLVPALNRTLPTHPLFARYMDFSTGRVRPVDTVERTRAHVLEKNYRALPFYKEVASVLKIEDQLVMQITVKQGRGVLLTFHSDRLFTAAEELKAAILRGHILARQYTFQQQQHGLMREAEKVRHELLELLTRREREVLRWLCRGLSNSEISLRLGISTRTVDRHVCNLLAKLELDCRTRVIARYAAWIEERAE